LVVRLLGIFIAFCESLTLPARFLTAALLLTGLLTWRLVRLTGLVLVRHGVSFHGNTRTTGRNPGSFLTMKKCGSQRRHLSACSDLRLLIHVFLSSATAPRRVAEI
jgi:hypothetical protein